MCGLGGILVEILHDVSFRLAPISRADAFEMLAELRGTRLLDGVRGRPPVDRAALADLLLAIAGPDGLATDPTIEELDLNPVFAYPDGVIIVDAGIMYEGSPPPHPPPPCAGEGEQSANPPSPRARGRGLGGWGPSSLADTM